MIQILKICSQLISINTIDVPHLNKIQKEKTKFMEGQTRKIHVRSSKNVVNFNELLARKTVGKISGSAVVVNFLPHSPLRRGVCLYSNSFPHLKSHST